jgi:hypothetical protein
MNSKNLTYSFSFVTSAILAFTNIAWAGELHVENLPIIDHQYNLHKPLLNSTQSFLFNKEVYLDKNLGETNPEIDPFGEFSLHKPAPNPWQNNVTKKEVDLDKNLGEISPEIDPFGEFSLHKPAPNPWVIKIDEPWILNKYVKYPYYLYPNKNTEYLVYNVEFAYNGEVFVNDEIYEQSGFCDLTEGDDVIFLTGSANGQCFSAELLNLKNLNVCSLWCR